MRLSPADELHVVLLGVKAEEDRAERRKQPPDRHHVSVPQLRLVPEGSDRVHQVRCLLSDPHAAGSSVRLFGTSGTSYGAKCDH